MSENNWGISQQVKITIIGLGAGSIDELSVKAYNSLLDGAPIYLRTDRHPVAAELEQRGVKFVTFDSFFEKLDDFEEIYDKIIAETLDKSEKYGRINYCIAGSPYSGDVVTEKLLKRNSEKLTVEVIDGMSFLDKSIKLSKLSNNDSMKVLNSTEVDEFSFDVNSVNIISQVDNMKIASELKMYLSEVYPDNFIIKYIDVLQDISREIKLFELDRQEKYGYSVYICIPTLVKKEIKLYNIVDLCRLMKYLRSSEGCPWDRKQTHESIRACLIEEAYEVVNAIDLGDIENFEEELGDLLLQVVFHSQIASEEGYFNINDVIRGICEKLYNRHPHVFGDNKALNEYDAHKSWDKVKAKERKNTSYSEILEGVPKSFSPLLRSYKIQKKAAEVGFDWPDIDGAIDKVKEEILELMVEFKKMDNEKIEDELGDVFFSLVNFARYLKIDPDIAVNKTINKFLNRFKYIEENASKDLKQMKLEEMDILWEKSKSL